MKRLLVIGVTLSLSFFALSSHAQNKLTDREIFARGYVLKDEQKKFVDKEYIPGEKPTLYTIEKGKKETKVTFLQPLYFDSQWIHYSKGYVIVDKKRGGEYLVRGYDNDIPMGRVITVRGCNGRMIYITLIFPKLKNRVKFVDIIERAVEDDPTPSNNNGIPTSYMNVRVKDYSPKAVRKYEAKKAAGKINIYK